MKSSTLVAVRAIVLADAPKSQKDKVELLAALGLNDAGGSRENADRIVSFSETAQRLSCSKRALHNWVSKGVIHKVTFPGATRARGFLASDVDALLRTDKVA